MAVAAAAAAHSSAAGAAPAAGEPPDAAGLTADVFKKLYPELYIQRFLQAGVRPDGRALGACRPCSIGAASISSADGSALVKLGSSSALVGVKLDIVRPAEGSPGRGEVLFNVELAPFATANYRPGRPPEWVAGIAHRLNLTMLGDARPAPYSAAAGSGMDGPGGGSTSGACISSSGGSSGVMDLAQLCISDGKAAWRAHVDVYVLDADGSVFDVVLLGAVTALASTRLPPVVLTKDGGARRARKGRGAGGPGQSAAGGEEEEDEGEQEGGTASRSRAEAGDGVPESSATSTAAEFGHQRTGSSTAGQRIQLRAVPLSLSSGVVQPGGFVLSDPTSEEEEVASSTVTVVLDAAHQLRGLYKIGGDAAATPRLIRQCIEAAKMRYKDVHALLQQALTQDEEAAQTLSAGPGIS